MRPLALATLLLLTAADRAAAQAAADPLDGFDAFLAAAVRDWHVPGLAVAVVKDGEVVFAKGYGVREVGKPAPVDTHTRFAVGSTTKAMTAAAIGLLVDEGKVGWDDPVSRHLPWFQLRDPYVTREVTVRDLLTHRAGLGNADFLWYGTDTPAREVLERLRFVDPAYSLRGDFIYQNLMYAAAGAVVEAVSGMPWTTFVERRLFAPLGMTETTSTLGAVTGGENVAAPHDRVDGVIVPIENASVDSVAAAGSVWSSVHDMAAWMRMLLGAPGAPRLLEDDTLAELFEPQVIIRRGFYPTTRLTKPKWTTYGLGWFQQDYEGRALDFHTGSIDGMAALLALDRPAGLGVVVLTNLAGVNVRHAIMFDVLDRFAGRRGRDWSAELTTLYDGIRAEANARAAKAREARVAGTSPSLPLARYAGTYRDPLHGEVVVTHAGGALQIRTGPGFEGPLTHWHYDTFQADWRAAWRGEDLVTFVLDRDGQPSILEMRGARFRRAADERSIR